MAEQLVLTADTQKRNPYVPLSLCVCVYFGFACVSWLQAQAS